MIVHHSQPHGRAGRTASRQLGAISLISPHLPLRPPPRRPGTQLAGGRGGTDWSFSVAGDASGSTGLEGGAWARSAPPPRPPAPARAPPGALTHTDAGRAPRAPVEHLPERIRPPFDLSRAPSHQEHRRGQEDRDLKISTSSRPRPLPWVRRRGAAEAGGAHARNAARARPRAAHASRTCSRAAWALRGERGACPPRPAVCGDAGARFGARLDVVSFTTGTERRTTA